MCSRSRTLLDIQLHLLLSVFHSEIDGRAGGQSVVLQQNNMFRIYVAQTLQRMDRGTGTPALVHQTADVAAVAVSDSHCVIRPAKMVLVIVKNANRRCKRRHTIASCYHVMRLPGLLRRLMAFEGRGSCRWQVLGEGYTVRQGERRSSRVRVVPSSLLHISSLA